MMLTQNAGKNKLAKTKVISKIRLPISGQVRRSVTEVVVVDWGQIKDYKNQRHSQLPA